MLLPLVDIDNDIDLLCLTAAASAWPTVVVVGKSRWCKHNRLPGLAWVVQVLIILLSEKVRMVRKYD